MNEQNRKFKAAEMYPGDDDAYKPIKPVATFTDRYGDERVIHRPQHSRGLRVFCGTGTPTMRLNRAVAKILAANIRRLRVESGLSQRELCQRAGFVDQNPKQRIYAIENASRGHGVRLGTLYALAHALECEITDLLPSAAELYERAGVGVKTVETIG